MENATMLETATDHTPTDRIAGTLATFVHRLRPERGAADISQRARHLMLDAIGCALAARAKNSRPLRESGARTPPAAKPRAAAQ